jgi:hypothetical protein
VGAATIQDIQRLLQWKVDLVDKTLDILLSSGFLEDDVTLEGQRDKYFVLQQLL